MAPSETSSGPGADELAHGVMPIRRALLSVTDKSGIVELGQALAAQSVEVLSTGGTAKALRDAGVAVRAVEDLTGFPECFDGRVKTLHPKVHGGILHMRGNPEHRRQADELAIEPIDLVAVNLYAFDDTVARDGVTLEEAIENIDIGGPSMIRSAAKNWRDVVVVTDPCDYERVVGEIAEHGGVTRLLRFELAAKAFALTARYDASIANFLESRPDAPDTLTPRLRFEYVLRQELRYGENPHQAPAVFYAAQAATGGMLAAADQLGGKELSFNNLVDLDAALGLVREFCRPAAVCVKHTNPCGAAMGSTLAEAFSRAHAGDPLSAYGCIVGLNQVVDVEAARTMAEEAGFVEAIIAPGFSNEALEILRTRPTWRKNVRLLQLPGMQLKRPTVAWKQISGGLLAQPEDAGFPEWKDLKTVTQRAPDEREKNDLYLAWVLCKHVKSNAIVLVKDGMLVGLGAGQVSRVDSVSIAVMKAGERAQGSVLASDAFFPFRDGVDAAANAGITAVVQPGGSKRDDDSIAAADEHEIAMVFTGRRHFKH